MPLVFPAALNTHNKMSVNRRTMDMLFQRYQMSNPSPTFVPEPSKNNIDPENAQKACAKSEQAAADDETYDVEVPAACRVTAATKTAKQAARKKRNATKKAKREAVWNACVKSVEVSWWRARCSL